MPKRAACRNSINKEFLFIQVRTVELIVKGILTNFQSRNSCLLGDTLAQVLKKNAGDHSDVIKYDTASGLH